MFCLELWPAAMADAIDKCRGGAAHSPEAFPSTVHRKAIASESSNCAVMEACITAMAAAVNLCSGLSGLYDAPGTALEGREPYSCTCKPTSARRAGLSCSRHRRQGPNPSLMFALSHSWPLTSCGACSEATQGHDGISRDVLLLHLFSGKRYGSNSCSPNITVLAAEVLLAAPPVSSSSSSCVLASAAVRIFFRRARYLSRSLSKPRMRILWRTFLQRSGTAYLDVTLGAKHMAL